jgi:magnesium transporter
MRKIVKKRSKKFGRGSRSGREASEAWKANHLIQVMRYDGGRLDETDVRSAAACKAYRQPGTVAWFDVAGLDDVQLLLHVGEVFGLDDLVLEDATSVGQRPKLEDHGDYLFVALTALFRDPVDGHLEHSQVSILLGDGFVLTFREHEQDLFEPIRERLRDETMRIRQMGADYLAYALIDLVLDEYYATLEEVGDRQQKVEEEIMDGNEPEMLRDIHRIKRDLVLVRKFTWPLRAIVADLRRSESRLISPGVRNFITDLDDHAFEVLESVETLRDIAAGQQDVYLSNVSNRMNEVMKTLTIIATIFIPLTFIAGIYGMNFDAMPELRWPGGYPAVLALMFAIAGGMVAYFRKKRWL